MQRGHDAKGDLSWVSFFLDSKRYGESRLDRGTKYLRLYQDNPPQQQQMPHGALRMLWIRSAHKVANAYVCTKESRV